MARIVRLTEDECLTLFFAIGLTTAIFYRETDPASFAAIKDLTAKIHAQVKAQSEEQK
jgi:hypothetical protein